jgi:hypothetical protein
MLHSNLNEIHVLGLQSFRTLLHFKGNARALIERAVSTGRDRGEVHEDIFSILSLDKSKSLRGVKPLHCSCFFQNDSFYFYKCCANVSIDDGGTGEESKTRKPVQRNSKDVQVQLRFSLALPGGSRCSPWSQESEVRSQEFSGRAHAWRKWGIGCQRSAAVTGEGHGCEGRLLL